MGQAAERMGMTEQEYLAFERASPQKHEFADGEIFAMSGGTREHSLIATNINREIGTVLFDRPCEVHGSDMRVKIVARNRYVYPDGSVVCGGFEYGDGAKDTLLNPCLIVEVLSDTSEAYDRGDKFDSYRTIPSLKHYIIAPQDKPQLEIYTRQDNGGWLLRTYGPGEKAALSALGCELDVDRVYARVFPPAAA